MTCILGYVDNDTVYLAADGQTTAGYKKDTNDCDKILINGDIIAAFSGTMNSINVLEDVFNKINPNKILDLKEDIFDYFFQPVKQELKRRDVVGDSLSFSALIGKGNILLETNCYFTIVRHKKKAGIGSGSQYALGSLEVLERTSKLPTLQKLKISMEISDFFDAASNNNIKYANTKELKVKNL